MSEKRTQIYFGLNMEEIEEAGMNWYNIVLDTTEYLKEKGFSYSRTLSFINDRELSEDELAELITYITENIADIDCFSYFEANVISNIQSMLPRDKACGKIREKSIYRTIIEIKHDITEEEQQLLSVLIENAFANRAGTVKNVCEEPYRFEFVGTEKDYGCLEVGLLNLKKEDYFLSRVSSWQWIDADPDESCDVLEVFSKKRD